MNRIADRRKALVKAMQNILPTEYQRVKYIESSGTQYINTGVAPNGVQFGIEVKFSADINALDSAQSICGSLKASTPYRWHGIGYNTTYHYFYIQYSKGDSSKTFRFSPTDNNFEISYSIAGTEIAAVMNTSTYSDTCDDYSTNINSIYLFARNDGGSAALKSCVKIHKVKITSNNQLIREFIPCYRKSDSVVGMYDLVNGVFYTNAGTGTFLKGADVN